MDDYFKRITDFDGYLKEEVYLDYAKKKAAESAVYSPQIFGSYGIKHDYWNAYRYGNEIKVVYIKKGIIEYSPEQLEKRKKYKSLSQKSDCDRFKQSLIRTRSRVFELAMCNEFSHFCTFTQDKKMRDRFDLNAFRKDFTMFIRNKNRNRFNNKITYLLIPEQHKDGAWHMHGLLNGLTDEDLRPFKLSEYIPKSIKDKIRKGEKIYDWTSYRRKFGYFTCENTKNSTACAKYITKYITKDLQLTARENNAHLFFASQGLKGRECLVKNSFDYCPFTDWDFENDYVKICTVKDVDFF